MSVVLLIMNMCHILIDPHTNNKKFWSHIKSCLKDYTGISTHIVEGNTITDDLDKANALNN